MIEITLPRANSRFNFQFGKIDIAGQSQSKIFPDNEAAQRYIEKLVAEKLRKKYVESPA